MRIKIALKVNGQEKSLEVDANRTLLEVLREDFGYHGAREACGAGVCGACTVLLNGKPVSSCLMLAWMADGGEIETIEGLAQGGKLHPIQQAFVEEGAFQCGFCTPGMILAAKSLLDQSPEATEEQIKDYMEGNLCRCGSYPKVIKAVKSVQAKMGGGQGAH